MGKLVPRRQLHLSCRGRLWSFRRLMQTRDISVRSRITSELVVPEEEPYATNAARQKAERLRVDLHELRGSGVDGRITYKGVSRAVQG